MSDNSAIEWTNASWNPVTGCTRLSAGCDHCYAERFSERFRDVPGHPFEPGFDLTLRPERLGQPERWRRPRLIFVNSMSDLFHKNIPAEFLGRVFDVMEKVDRHVYQVLTKRSSLMRSFVNRRYAGKAPPSHIWLGVSIENASTLSRLRHLKQTNAAVRFVSFEPLLGPVGAVDLTGIHWVIAGGESGPGARKVDIEWLREIRDRCQAERVAFFFKQWGGRSPKSLGNELDNRHWLEYPDHPRDSRDGGRKGASWADGRLRAAGAPPEDDGETMDVGLWAKEKLACLEKCLQAYTKNLRKKKFKGYFYVDAFAGPGSLKVRKQESDRVDRRKVPIWVEAIYPEVATHTTDDADKEQHVDDADEEQYIAGSPRVALEIEPPFTDYVFVEKNDDRIAALRTLKQQNEAPGKRIHIRTGDCNDYLHELLRCNRGQWRHWRGFVFLDPFGMQVPWNTIAALAETKAIDVFINFPAGMAIQRLLNRRGDFTAEVRNKLDWYFGTDEWFDQIYCEYNSLFDKPVFKKDAKARDTLVKWYCDRLKNVFGYVSSAREIQIQDGHPLYYLIYAGPNQARAHRAGKILKKDARRVI